MLLRHLLPAVTVLIAITTQFQSGPVSAQEPLLFEAEYKARSSGLSATAERKLVAMENGNFQLSNHMEVRVLGARLGAVEETSQFQILDGSVVPEAYRYRQSGVSRRERSVQFDWETATALSSEDDETWTLPLTAGVVDSLSFQLVLRRAFSNSEITEVQVSLADKDEIENHLYRVTGNEIIDTGLGRLETLKVERIREPGSRRHTTFWLAKDWHLLLVKFEQTNGSKSGTELLLEKASVDGLEVTPLP